MTSPNLCRDAPLSSLFIVIFIEVKLGAGSLGIADRIFRNAMRHVMAIVIITITYKIRDLLKYVKLTQILYLRTDYF